MKRSIKRILSLAFVLLLLLSAVAPAFAADATTRTVPLSMTAPTGKTSRWGFTLAGSNKNFTIKLSDVKVTPGTSDVKLVSFRKTTSSDGMAELQSDGTWISTLDKADYRYRVELKFTKPGTAKLTYKVGTKTYTVKLVVKPYENTVKTFTITGVNSGNNLASKTASRMNPTKALALNKTTKNATLKVVPASGCKIRQLEIIDLNTGSVRVFRNDKGVSSASLRWGTLNAGHNYQVILSTLRPAGDGGYFAYTSEYYIHGAKAS